MRHVLALALVVACTPTERPVGERPVVAEPTPDEPREAPTPGSPAQPVETPVAVGGLSALTRADAAVRTTLDRARPGKALWLSHNARYAVIQGYDSDVGGRLCERLASSEVVLYDTVTGAREAVDWFIGGDARGRHAVVRSGDKLWLLDADAPDARLDLTTLGAMADRDTEHCWGGAPAAFDPVGAHVMYFRERPTAVVLRDLDTGAEKVFPAGPGAVWRAWPAEAEGWVRVESVTRDTDRDGRLDCPFTADRVGRARCSPGFMREWGDRDATVEFMLHKSGARIEVEYPPPGRCGVRDSGLLGGDRTELQVYGAGGAVKQLPKDCDLRDLRPGSGLALIECDEQPSLLLPGKRPIAAPQVAALFNVSPREDARGERWSGALLLAGERRRVARVSLVDGRIVDGPVCAATESLSWEDGLGEPNRDGWMLVQGDAGLFAFDLAEGTVRVLPAAVAERLGPGWASLAGIWHAFDLRGGRVVALAGQPALVAEDGCALVPAKYDMNMSSGPWSLVCPG